MENKKLEKVLKSKDLINKIENVLDKEVEVLYKDSLRGENAGFPGWSFDLYVGEDGDIYVSEPLSQGTQSMDSYMGREVCLLSIPCFNFIDYQIVTKDYIDTLSEKQKEDLKYYIASEEGIDISDEDELNRIDIYDDHDWIFDEKFHDLYNEAFEDYIDRDWDDTKDYFLNKIKERISFFLEEE